MANLLTTGEVARELGVPVERLRDLIRRRKLPETRSRFPGQRAWTREELAIAREIVKRNPTPCGSAA